MRKIFSFVAAALLATTAMFAATAPEAAATAPTWPADQVKAIYSPTYQADCVFGEWSSGTVYAQEDFGKKYVTTDLGYFGMTDFSLNCSNMEKLHFDFWIAEDASVRIVPIWKVGGAEQGVTVELKGQQWNAVDLALTQYDQVADWSNIYQVKIDEARNLTFWIGNAFFYREAAIEDSEAPTNFKAELASESFYSVTIAASAEDNMGTLNYAVINGELQIATASGNSGETTNIIVAGLEPNTEYTLNVIAKDEAGNAVDPIEVKAKTAALPAPAPKPDFTDRVGVPLFCDALENNPGIALGAWGQTTVAQLVELAEGDHAYLLTNTNYQGWEFTPHVNAANMTYLHIDFYTTDMQSIRFTPISPSHEGGKTVELTAGEWTSVDVPLTDYADANIDWADIFQFKIEQANPDKSAVIIDNIYFYRNDDDPVYNTLADVMTMEKDAEVVLGAFDVVLVQGSNIYVKDATAAGLIYAYNFGLKAGDHVAAGLAGKLDIYNGLYEVKPTSKLEDLTVTEGATPSIPNANALPSAENMNEVVIYKNVQFAEAVTINADAKNATGKWNDQDLAIFNQFKLDFIFEAGKAYNIKAANGVYAKNDNVKYQVYFISAEEYSDQEISDHGLYNAAEAELITNRTYFATGDGWAPDTESSAELIDGQVYMHIALTKQAEWQSQVFVDGKINWQAGKKYKIEFDLETNKQLGGVHVKINDSDEEVWFDSYPNDNFFLANQDVHFVGEPVEVRVTEDQNGLLIFSVGWCDAGTEVRIHNIRVVETGDLDPIEEPHMYIKHPWGTGADADWTWKELTALTYGVYEAWAIEDKWGGVGCNINDKAEDNGATWYPADKIQFLSPDELVLQAPAVGTDVMFVYIPALKDSQIVSPVKVIYTPTGVEDLRIDQSVIKTIIDGQVVIIRNGVRYNALGAQL